MAAAGADQAEGDDDAARDAPAAGQAASARRGAEIGGPPLLAAEHFVPACDAWLSGWDESFSRRLAAHGWVGMTVPPEYGGHGRSALERYVVVEELLAAGAPVAAHWVSDRQIVPNLLRYGSEELKRRYLPAIARGACYFAIGLSEPDAGSDLAAVRTAASRADGGWTVSGVKIWTSGAHRAHALIALLRTGPAVVLAGRRRSGGRVLRRARPGGAGRRNRGRRAVAMAYRRSRLVNVTPARRVMIRADRRDRVVRRR